MKARTLMIQGTGSYVGKSVLVAALCRIFRQDGFQVAPFKAQNMALNSFVTRDGGEMGRSQVVQAEAAGVEPSVDMNPILIKPEADTRSQVVVLGKPRITLDPGAYYRRTPELLRVARGALERLRSRYEIVVIEGAGSPAEINLKDREIVNMRIAKLAGSPVLLVGDIDKGGVFASLVGTLALLEADEREYVKGFIINKFRGEVALLQPGLEQLERLTQKPVVGVVPYHHGPLVPEEDSVSIWGGGAGPLEKAIHIAVIHLAHISNSTDFEPLQQEEDVHLYYVREPAGLGEPDVIILPGSKSTVADLALLRQMGLAGAIVERAGAGTPVVGICGGFQMLGQRICDPHHVESRDDSVPGMGLLPVDTAFEATKATSQVRARVEGDRGLLAGAGGQEVIGYEIHMGRTTGQGATPPFRIIRRPEGEADYPDGAQDPEGN
ncbi:MAG: cobyric acid synthase, partial [Dehalococcoidia bacterium]